MKSLPVLILLICASFVGSGAQAWTYVGGPNDFRQYAWPRGMRYQAPLGTWTHSYSYAKRWERALAQEQKAIETSDAISEILRGQPIADIQRIENGTYAVSSANCTVVVAVSYSRERWISATLPVNYFPQNSNFIQVPGYVVQPLESPNCF